MDDLKFGVRDKRGDWSPNEHIQVAPFYRMPPQPVALLKWLPHYIFPWPALFAALAVAYWHFVVPDVAVLKTVSWQWVLKLYVVNSIAVFLFFGALELRLYIRRDQAQRFKYNAKSPGDQRNAAFLFNSQNLEGMLRTFGSGIPIWTAYEVGMLWAYANGYAPWLSFADNWFYLLLIAFFMPMWHEAHFFTIHRLIHWRPLYKWVHSVHHNSVNPSPWSSLSMHTVEHLLYFSGALIHLIIPSNPILAIYQLHIAGFGSVVGHIGFDKIELNDETAFDSHAYTHYLHHKHFEVNYGDGLVPFDKLFGTWHDGSPEAEAAMRARFEKRKLRARATA